MEDYRYLLEEFVSWAKERSEGVFFIFDDTDDAINEFLEQFEND